MINRTYALVGRYGDAVMREMNAATVGNSWYCEKHIVE